MGKNKISKVKIGKFVRKRKKPLIIVTLAIITFIIIFVAGSMLGLWSVRPTSGDATVQVIDMGDIEDVSDEAKVSVYESPSYDGLSVKEAKAIDYDDYEKIVDDKHAEDVSFYVKEHHIYQMKISYKDTTIWQAAEPGENVVFIVDKTENVTLLIYDDNGATTLLGNTELTYHLNVICDSDDEGLQPDYLFNIDDSNLIWFDINLTRFAQSDYARIDDYHNTKEVSGTHLYIGVPGTIIDEADYDIVFASGKAGGTWDCNNIEVGFGTYNSITWLS